MHEKRDRRLMLDMLRYPAKLFFRDEHIAIVQANGEESYQFWSPTPMPASRYGGNRDFEHKYIVRANNKESFEVNVSHMDGYGNGGSINFGKAAFLDAHVSKGETKTYSRSIVAYLKKYPSLYDAFEEKAIERAFLPMIRRQTDDIIMQAIKHNMGNIGLITNLTHKRKLKILEQNVRALEYLSQTPEMADFAIKHHGGSALSYISEFLRTQKICERAVSDCAMSLQHVPNKTEKICLIAIKRDAMALQFVNQPSMKLMVTAVNRSPDAWDLIKKEKVRKEVKKAKKQKKYLV